MAHDRCRLVQSTHSLVLAAALLAIAAPFAALADERAIDLYDAVGTAQGITIEGRVIEKRRNDEARADDGWLKNLWRNARRLVNDEQKHVALSVKLGSNTLDTKSDNEGYFKVSLAATGLAPGWHAVSTETTKGDARATGNVLLVPASNRVGLISDIDDTIQISEVLDKSRLLKHSLLQNPLQRSAVPGMAQFYARLIKENAAPAATPVIYLSASPRQLTANIQQFLDTNHFPRGVLITKKVTNDKSSDPLLDQAKYKTAKIEALIAQLPWVRWVLVGDDGEKDPEIYHDITKRYPQQVRAVWIRHVNPDPKRPRYAGQGDLARALGSSK